MMQLLQIVTVLVAMQTMPGAQTPTGTIRVTVTMAGTQQPLAGARVTLQTNGEGGHLDLPNSEADLLAYLTQLAIARGVPAGNINISVDGFPPSAAIGNQQPRVGRFSPITVLTNDKGEAVFENVPLGSYQATAGSVGNAAAAGGSTRSFLSDTVSGAADVTAAQPAQVVSLVFGPAASISGQVIDLNGMAIPNVAVSLATPGAQNGLPALLGRTVRTDSQGNYRISPVGPGYYYVRVQLAPSASPSTYSFYPAASNVTKAVMVPVRGGEDIVGIDLTMPSSFKITGTVLNSEGSIRALYLLDPRGISPIRNLATDLNGRFAVEDIPPGTWDIFATFGRASMQTGRARVNVVDRDVSEVTIEDDSSDLRGRFVTSATASIIESLKVSLFSLQNLPGPVNTHVQAPVPVSSDGAFFLRGITPGPYRLVIQPLPAGYSITEIRIGGRRLVGDIIIVRERSTEAIEVVLSD